MSGGWFAFSRTPRQTELGIEDDEASFFEDIMTTGRNANDPELARAFLDRQHDAYTMLERFGADFGTVEISAGQSVARSHLGDVRSVMSALEIQFVELGGFIRLNSRVTALHRDGSGRIAAVTVDAGLGPEELVTRRGVVIASGGFSRSEGLLATFAPEQVAAIPFGGRGNTGDGLKMAWALGADMKDMAYINSTYGSHPDTGDDHELLTAFYMGAIIVNTAGDRFTDESAPYKTLGEAVLKQPGALAFQVFDQTVRDASHEVPLRDIAALEARGHVLSASTLPELAKLMNVEATRLDETVKTYNSIGRGEVDDLFGRSGLCNGVGSLIPLERAPFYAYPSKPLMTSTYCGLRVDKLARVVGVDGKVMPGLYAVGEVIGGFHGASYLTGTALSKCAVFGLIAAEHAVVGDPNLVT